MFDKELVISILEQIHVFQADEKRDGWRQLK